MTRDGTCIEDVRDDRGWMSECGHGYLWRLGDLKAACARCVLAQCDHPKAGRPVEQGRLL